MLSEVGFEHAGEAAFIELWNAGPAPADVSGAGLAVDGTVLPVALGQESLAADARLFVAFDGVLLDPSGYPAASPSIVPAADAAGHAATSAAPVVQGGTVDLLDVYGRPVDHVAWGDEPDAVRTGLGGVVPDALDPAGAIGRAPGEWGADDRLAWVPYGPGEGTPGEANSLPAVPVLLPLDGSIFEEPRADLTWYPVPGAAAYRVQVARDGSFASPVVDVTAEEPEATTDDLAPGSYVWRVAPLWQDGSTADFSATSSFEIEAATAAIELAVAHPSAATDPPAQTAPRILDVPMLFQHKDTPMLLLERPVRNGRHGWDLDHGVLDRRDPSDGDNCVLAAVAMINHVATGQDLSQDRIGYEIRKADRPGPEGDLNYGDGLTNDQIMQAMTFAMSTAPTYVAPAGTTREEMWATIVAQIDRGVPILAATPGHAFVIVGYEITPRGRVVHVNNPWSGRRALAFPVGAPGAAAPSIEMWLLARASRARRQEPTVNMDSDGDGVVDFDEIERFHTDPNLADTDLDDVLDKEEIAATVFDRTYGYAAHPTSGARDFDSDGRAMERDPDSDDGGCEDGQEDENGDGIRDRGETWNFEAGDDPCSGYNGSLTWTSHYAVGSVESWSRIEEMLVVTVRLKPNPDDPKRSFVDDGSTYHYLGRTRSFIKGLPGCNDVTDLVRRGLGGFEPGDIGGGIVKEYEPGKDGFSLGARAPWRGVGRHTNCIIDEPITDASAAGTPSCWGLENKQDGIPERTFVFDCKETIGAGFFGNEWTLKGSVTVR